MPARVPLTAEEEASYRLLLRLAKPEVWRKRVNACSRRWRIANAEYARLYSASQSKKFRALNPGYDKQWKIKNPDKARALADRGNTARRDKARRERESRPITPKMCKGLPVSTAEDKREYRRLFALAFPERGRSYTAKWQQQNLARVRKSAARWRKSNPDKVRASKRRYDKARRTRDLGFRIKVNLRRRLNTALKQSRGHKVLSFLGCSINDFKIYLESKWEPGMSWENYGRQNGEWQVDHIMPCAIFDLTREDHRKRCFHFSNCQPLWREANLAKRFVDGSIEVRRAT
jgi:hypothetical protein